jgi:hypothetical protein
MPKILIALAVLLLFGCYNPKKFDIVVEHKTSNKASMKMELNPKYVKVTIKHKNFIGINNTSSYKRSISNAEAKQFYSKLNTLKIDTLKASYTNTFEFNEESHFTIARKDFKTINTHLQNAATPATDSLLRWIDKLILNENFKYRLEQ